MTFVYGDYVITPDVASNFVQPFSVVGGSFTNYGSIHGYGPGNFLYQDFIQGHGNFVRNYGYLAVTTDGNLLSAAIGAAVSLVENIGAIVAVGPQVAGIQLDAGGQALNGGSITVSGNIAIGIELSQPGHVHNTGNITAETSSGGTYGPAGVVIAAGSTFVNDGLVTTDDHNSIFMGAGIRVLYSETYQPSPQTTIIENNGAVVGDWAIFIENSSDSVQHVTNTGLLDGAVDLAAGDDILINSGQIAGHVYLSDGADTYQGATAQGSVRVDGGWGNDILIGGAGNDILGGYTDNDTLKGGAGNDRIDGEWGVDTVDYTDLSTNITGNAASTWVGTGDGFYDQVTGMEVWRLGSGNDTLITWAGQETVYGGAGNDWVGDYGVNQNNTFYGEDGDDSLYGLGGSDVLWGGTGADFLVGGDGADYIIGGAGIDWMDGQGGADTFFIYALSEIQGGWEAIANFQSGVDKLNVQYIDADGNAGNGETAFTVTTTGFTNTAGQIYIERPGGQNYAFVRFDTNGDSVADALLFVTGTALTSADFIL